MTTVMLLNERNKQKQKMRLTIFFINLMRDAYQGYNNSMSKSKSEPVQNVFFDPEQTSNESIEIC